MDNEQFIQSSKLALRGSFLGIVGNTLFQLFLSVIVILTLSIIAPLVFVGAEDPAGSMQDYISKIPVDAILSLVSYLLTFILFILLFSWSTIVRLFKSIFTQKALIYGLIGVGALLAFNVTYNLITTKLFNLNEDGNQNQQGVIQLIRSAPLLAFFVICLGAPIIEELGFRYSLFGGLLKTNRLQAYLFSALVFMMMHSLSSIAGEISTNGMITAGIWKELITLPPYAFSGLVLCYVYENSVSLGSSIIAHFFNNFISYALIFLSILLENVA